MLSRICGLSCFMRVQLRVTFCSGTSDPHLVLVRSKIWTIPNIGVRSTVFLFYKSTQLSKQPHLPRLMICTMVSVQTTSAQMSPPLDGCCKKLKRTVNPGSSTASKSKSLKQKSGLSNHHDIIFTKAMGETKVSPIETYNNIADQYFIKSARTNI